MALPAAPATSGVSADAATAQTTPPVASAPAPESPASQLAPALMSLANGPGGAQRLTLRLAPPELGQVQIRIERPQDAPPRVDITVEQSATLILLLRDQPQLQRTLDQAGVPQDGRSVTFHLAPPETNARPDAAPTFAPGAGTAGQTGAGWHGPSRQGGGPRHPDPAIADDTDFTPAPPPTWLRAGLDITA